MFDSIKKLITNLINGLVSFITGLLPGKKKGNGYYLELDEAKEAAKGVASNAKKAAETLVSDVKQAAETVASNAQQAAETVTSNAQQAAKPASLNGKKTTKTKTKAKAAKKTEPAEEPNKNAKAAAAKVVKELPTETTFAPKYLAPSATSSNGRRRPGANMSAYLDMARQVKTPN